MSAHSQHQHGMNRWSTIRISYLDGPACFILNIDHPDEQDQLLIQLRMHPRWFMFPVFILQSSPLSAYLCDGLLQDDLLLRIEQFEQRYQLLKLDPEKGS